MCESLMANLWYKRTAYIAARRLFAGDVYIVYALFFCIWRLPIFTISGVGRDALFKEQYDAQTIVSLLLRIGINETRICQAHTPRLLIRVFAGVVSVRHVFFYAYIWFLFCRFPVI